MFFVCPSSSPFRLYIEKHSVPQEKRITLAEYLQQLKRHRNFLWFVCMNLVQVGAQRLPEHLRGAGWITGAGCQHPSGVQKHKAWFVVGRIHSGVQFAGSAVSAISSSFPEPHVTALTVQLDPPPSWFLPFLFFVPFNYYEMAAACPTSLSLVCCRHSSASPGVHRVPSGRLLMPESLCLSLAAFFLLLSS